jgi:hypothetical protein
MLLQEIASEPGEARHVRAQARDLLTLGVLPMLLVDRQSGTASAGHAGSNPMHLRLRADGRLVELPLGKTTIGSSPRCSLRIQTPGVQPVHCLIVHGPEGLSVRRWAADTQLNGRPFDDSPLAAGDCLALGGVELELVGAEQVSQQSNDAPMPSVSDAGGTCDQLMDSVQESVAAVSELENMPCDIACDTCEPEIAESEVREPEVASEPALVEVPAPAASHGAEAVFRELQAACVISRGRNRKLLAALREKRDRNHELWQQLVETRDQLADLNRERDDWEQSQIGEDNHLRDWEREVQGLRQEIGDLESCLAEHTRQMTELQQELAATRSSAESLGDAAVRYQAPPMSDVSKYVESVAIVAEEPTIEAAAPESSLDDSTPALEAPATDWTPAPDRPSSVWSEALTNKASVVEPTPLEIGETNDAGADADPWDAPAATSSEWASPAAGAEVEPEPARGESGWGSSHHEPHDEDVFGAGAEADALHVEQPVWASEAPVSTPEESTDDVSPFAEFSIWKQAATEKSSTHSEPESPAAAQVAEESPAWGSRTFDEPASVIEVDESIEKPKLSNSSANLWSTPAAEPESEIAATQPPKPKTEPTSFIDRYAHMFADDAASAPSPSVALSQSPQRLVSEPVVSTTRPLGQTRKESGIAPAAASDDEESIELYMSKLLQRVRGESPHVAASQVAPVPVAAREGDATAASSVTSLHEEKAAAPEADLVEPETAEEAAQAMVNWEAIARRAVAAGPPTNLGALRALANESARRAISRHELAKHRRNAVTKAIVATLAGMTSLWLMLDAPNWHDIQFITACGALVVAAYWAGQTYRSLLESLRAAAYDRPEAGAEHTAVGRQAALPIDV